MGNQLTAPQKSLIVMGCVLFIYVIGSIAYSVSSKKSIETPVPTPPAFTPGPTINPTVPPGFTPGPTINPTVPPDNYTPVPHLEFDHSALEGPPGFTSNFYRLGCKAAFSEGLFPFSKFDNTGSYHSGILCNYYTYDTWGFGGDTQQLNCGGNCVSGIKTNCSETSPPVSPNQPWTDEQCDICATASRDPNCIWTRASDSCYTTIARTDNVTFVPTYHGMDISQCYYKSQGNFDDKKLCCDPSVA